MATADQPGMLHQPDYLRGLAERLRVEAERAEARAGRLDAGAERFGCNPGCWNILSTCVFVEPL